MEIEKVFVIFRREIFLKHRAYKRLDAHFDIRLITARMARLGSFVAYDAVTIVFLAHLEQIDSIYTSEAQHEHCHIAPKFRQR
jgi:hypothetical protein